MSDPVSALHKAAERASYSITNRLRKEARNSGWNDTVVRNMQVVYDPKSNFDVEFADDVREQAMNLEYGTEIIRPTAAVRKYDNSRDAEEALAYFLEKELKKLL